MFQLADCPDCPGQVAVGRSYPLRVPKQDDEGKLVYDRRTGELLYVTLQLPVHVIPYSAFDPTGMVETFCEHGVTEHPLGFELRRGGKSFIRGKYQTMVVQAGQPPMVQCPVCRGEPRPDDLTEPAKHRKLA
jgi:hypothetical protein